MGGAGPVSDIFAWTRSMHGQSMPNNNPSGLAFLLSETTLQDWLEQGLWIVKVTDAMPCQRVQPIQLKE
jgi:hypothetical protein